MPGVPVMKSGDFGELDDCPQDDHPYLEYLRLEGGPQVMVAIYPVRGKYKNSKVGRGFQ